MDREEIMKELKELQARENLQDIIRAFEGVPICILMCELSITSIEEMHTEILGLRNAGKIKSRHLISETLDIKREGLSFLSTGIKLVE